MRMELNNSKSMAKIFQILVPDDKLVSRIISSEDQVTELFVIGRSDKDFVSQNSEDLKKPALYILVNRDTKQLYVGQTDDSYKRLKNHEAKDFWTEAIIFHSTNDTHSKTEVEWLEAKTYEVLDSLGYYDLSNNKQTPQYPKLKKNQIYTLEPIFEEAKAYICAAGFDIFLRINDEKPNSEDDEKPEQGSSETTAPKCYLTNKGRIPRYFTSLKGPFIKDVLIELNMNTNILEITDLDELEKVRKAVALREKEKRYHNQYACAISQYKHYLEKGYTYKEFEHDATLVKKLKKENNGKEKH